MRTFSDNVTTAFNYSSFKYFFLIKLELGTTTYRFTSYHSDLTITGDGTYTSDGGLFEVESPKFSSILDREAYRVIITDLVDELSNKFKQGVIGEPITVKVGIIDPATNEPLINSDDLIFIYKGYVDSPSIENSWDSKTAVIEGTSPMADLDQVNVTMVSKDGMDQLSQSDTSYDNIYDDQEIQLKWGKV